MRTGHGRVVVVCAVTVWSLAAFGRVAQADQVSRADFGPSAVVESFEGVLPGPNVNSQLVGSEDNAYLIPGTSTPYAFASGVTMTAPIPNTSVASVVIPDFAYAASLDPATSTEWGAGVAHIEVAEHVPFGDAFLAAGTSAAFVEFTFAEDMLRVGVSVLATTPYDVTMEAYDSGDALIETLAIEGVGSGVSAPLPQTPTNLIADAWEANFLGVENEAGIRKVRIYATNPALDGLIFENPDPDGDGIAGAADNCPEVPNPGQEDEDGDGLGDVCDTCTDTDGDGFGDPGFPANTCPEDNCPAVANPGQEDFDGDGSGDACDPDDDNDTVPDGEDDDPFDAFVCADADADGCDDCTSGLDDPANDGTDTDSDGLCDLGDPDDDNDTVPDGEDADPLNAFVCRDVDLDGCDDCNSGVDDVANDGVDADGDGQCDVGDSDDDNDGVPDSQDDDPFDPFVCRDTDADGCDDCVSGFDDPANDGGDFDADGLCDAGDPDDDNDGLADADEALFGTDPFDPDTDFDGLLDGTEVDTAAGTGCPDPLNPDSDGDTLSDGDEVAGGTDPCDEDSDGDGLPDNVDPLPTEPGATTGFLEDEARATARDILALDLELFTGASRNIKRAQRVLLAIRAFRAANRIAAGDIESAIDRLESLLNRIDGEAPPRDWMVDSPEKTDLADHVDLLILLLEFML